MQTLTSIKREAFRRRYARKDARNQALTIALGPFDKGTSRRFSLRLTPRRTASEIAELKTQFFMALDRTEWPAERKAEVIAAFYSTQTRRDVAQASVAEAAE